MHKTLYIDIDEEITSIIDRVRKADVSEIIVVSPKNSLLLQSVVNLRLLKKEADRRKKQLMIITQDKIGKKLIEKAGILVQSKPEKDLYLEEESPKTTYEPLYEEEAAEIKEELQKEEGAGKNIGTSDYFEDVPEKKIAAQQSKELLQGQKPKEIETEKIPNTKLGREAKANSKIKMSDIVAGKPKIKTKKQKRTASSGPGPEIPISFALKPIEMINQSEDSVEFQEPRVDMPREMGNVSIKKAEKFFRGKRRQKKEFENTKISGNIKKYFLIFTAIFVLLIGLSAAYFFLPKATLALQLKNQNEPISFNFIASPENKSPGLDENTLPANPESIEKEISSEFSSSGNKNGAGKASGKVVIYNEFSNQPQPLVATTRLETDDGKIFRITKNISVPGMTQVGSETKPGAIEAEVVADQSGENFNIGPATFKIPGFQSNQSKYEKFYAKSVKAMEGGNSQGSVRVITAQDIAGAKEKIAIESKKAAIDELRKAIPPDRKFFDDAIQFEVQGTTVSDIAGTEKEKFAASAKIRASVLSFQESDVKTIIKNNLAKQEIAPDAISFENPISYMLSDFDNQKKTIKFEAKTDVKTSPDFNQDNFKKGILGKSIEEAQIYAKNFPEIDKMNVALWPFFVKRLPAKESRIKVEIE